MPQINVTDLDFNSIKASLKTYLRSNSTFTDWDFDGSGLNFLLDVLAYNTHLNAINAHVAVNEAFLDSAQLRNNVVSHAKLLGYVPRSMIGATAIVDVIVTGGNAPGAPITLTLNRGTRFSAVSSSGTYNLVAVDNYTSEPVNTSGEYVFTSVRLKEGTLKTMKYVVDSTLDNQRFEIPDVDVDTTTLEVTVADPTESETLYYVPFTNIAELDENSLVYFTQENVSERYEVYFGDDVIGALPSNGSIVTISYIRSNGEQGNGLRSIRAAQTIDGFGTIAAVTVTMGESNASSFGGQERESIESIRFNAPLSFIAQNRAVTSDDYKAIILREFGEVDAISVWGGENDVEPKYGRVYISVKPRDADRLSDAQKNQILTILEGKNIITITPEFFDPDYTKLRCSVYFKYNPRLTNRTPGGLETAVYAAAVDYNTNNLNRFDGVFRMSEFLAEVDGADPGILNSNVHVVMFKDVVTEASVANGFDVYFASEILQTKSTESIMKPINITYNGVDYYLRDTPIDDTFNRAIYRYRVIRGREVRSSTPYGYIYADKGRVVLQNIRTDEVSTLRVEVPPNSYDIAPKRNQLVQIDPNTLRVSGERDTIAYAGASGAKNYETTPRQ